MYDDMIQYMRDQLQANDLEATKSHKTLFRKRSDHTLRVLAWAERLAKEYRDIDMEILTIATIFHDIGYATCLDKKEHAAESARICRAYLADLHFDEAKREAITNIVASHSQKHLLNQPGTAVELVVLMEADILDETGALGVLWDCMVQGQKENQSYGDTYQHIENFSLKGMKSNPLRSITGRKIWEEKHLLVENFYESLKVDLFGSRES